MEKIKETIKNLGKLSANSKREGYLGDATKYSFRRWVLILLEGLEVKKKKRKPSAYNLHVSKEMKAGKSMREAIETWKNKSTK